MAFSSWSPARQANAGYARQQHVNSACRIVPAPGGPLRSLAASWVELRDCSGEAVSNCHTEHNLALRFN